jgi:hypothetical protein
VAPAQVFAKLGIAWRRELHSALVDGRAAVVHA